MSCDVCNGMPGCPCCSEEKYEVCPDCDGTGLDEDGFNCPTCDGHGSVEVEPDFYDDYEPI